jgi:hypothetical protein
MFAVLAGFLLVCCSGHLVSTQNRRFKFHKRGQFFIGAHNETLPVIAMRVSKPDRSTVAVNP